MKYIRDGKRLFLGLLAFVASALVVAQGSQGEPQNGIENLEVSQLGGNTVVKMTMRNPLAATPANFSVSNPARVAFDFPATENALGRTVQQANEGELRSLNIVQVADRTRVVMNLMHSVPFETRVDGKIFYVTLLQQAASDAQNASSAAAQFSAGKAEAGVSHAIRDINFRRGKNGEARVVVDLSDADVGIDIKQLGSNLVVDFGKAELPEKLRRRLDVTDFATPVTTVNTMSQGESVRMVISPRGLWEHNAYQTDNQFVIEVKQIVEDPNKLVQGSRGGYQGEKLSLNFQNVEVRAVLQVISDFTNLNVVVSDSVTGSLTLRLKDVPWDQALDIILNTRGLDMRKNGNVIWIAPRDELAAKEKLTLESKQQISELEPTRTESFQLNYHKAKAIFDFLKTKEQSLLSKRGSAIVDERSNKIFVSDIPTKLDEIRNLIKEIDIPVRQVMIEARIVEADDGFVNKLGVRLGLQDAEAATGHRLGINSLRYGITGGSTPALTTFQNVVNLPVAGAAGSVNLSLFNGDQTRMLNLEISALETDNRGKTISNPRILTADQVEASIEQGDEVPYLQTSSAGAANVAFKKATLSLKVKPQITPDGRIIMTLDIHKDAIGAATAAGPAINTKQVKTEVLVDNGGTVVIGGIYTQNERKDVTRVPVLGDLPVLGALFRTTERNDTKTELLVFITPKIVSESLTVR